MNRKGTLFEMSDWKGMADKEVEGESGVESVKATISRYRGKVHKSICLTDKSQENSPESKERGSKAQELHIARMTVDKINENTRTAETITSRAELELLKAKKIVRELTFQIEELKSNAYDRTSQKPVQTENHQYMEMMRELENLKREVSKIKLDMECSLEEKTRAENVANAASLRLRSYIKTAEKLRKEIEEANEEEVLIELAQIQAIKEHAAIEARRKEEAENFEYKIRETRKRINFLREEVGKAKRVEEVLAITSLEADVLQNELHFIKEMDERMKDSEFQSVMEDLEAARKEQTSIKEEVFQLMTSMDLTRIELNNVLKEKGKMEKVEAKTEMYINKLNSKLLRLKDKLEIAKASEEKAKSMLPSFVLSLQEFEKVKEEAQKERKCIIEEITVTRDDIQKTELTTDLTEERLLDTMQEMEAVQKAEANALTKLKTIVERTVVDRASKNRNHITISKFEYDYLTGCANEAKEIAEKKVAAGVAWADALRANAKEMEIKTAMAMRELKELRLKEEQELNKMEILVGGTHGRNTVKTEKSCYKLTPIRGAKFRKLVGSPAVRRPIISTSLTQKRRRKVMHKIANYFANKQGENEKTVK